jgi:hypothetical protein
LGAGVENVNKSHFMGPPPGAQDGYTGAATGGGNQRSIANRPALRAGYVDQDGKN